MNEKTLNILINETRETYVSLMHQKEILETKIGIYSNMLSDLLDLNKKEEK